MKRRPLLWLGSLVVVVGIYLGAYYVMLDGSRRGPNKVLVMPAKPKYRLDNEWVEAFFLPAHRVDEICRSDFWESAATH
jgi:hypothetical protein